MKQILLLTILVLSCSFTSFGQENICPTIKMNSPSGITPVKSAMLFSVSIIGKFDSSKLSYKWTVTNGEIADGQGTLAIAVPTPKEIQGQIVTTTVEITGLPEGCQNSFSASGEIAFLPVCRCDLYEYEKLSWLDERNRLANLMIELDANPTAKGLILFSIKYNSELDLVLSRQRKILKFLEIYKIPSSRILMSINNEGYYRTRIRIIPEGAELPN